MKSQTIDEVIGGNLQLLRQAESMTIAEMADALALLTSESFSEVKLWRWETGRYHFKVTDLYLFSQLHGVNLLALLKPDDDKITHIKTGNRDTPVDSYVYDFFVDPAGTFTERATRLTERRSEGTPYVVDAINDINDRLGEKGHIGDWYSSLQLFVTRLAEALTEAVYPRIDDGSPENMQAWEELAARIESGDEKMPIVLAEGSLDIEMEIVTIEIEEGNDDGDTEEDE